LFPISKRTKLGVLAVLLLATAGVLKLIPAEHAPANSVGLFGACWRIGFVLAVFWLAYPDLVRLPRWLMPAVLLVGLAMARWPWLLWSVPAVIFVGWLLRPREPLPKQRR
jgi:hypothetical protein